MNRRNFIRTTAYAGIGLNLTPAAAYKKKKPVILLVSGWQDVNIGDIAHTPGLLHLLETNLPGSRIILWKRSRGEQVKALLQKNFPGVEVIYGDVDQKTRSTKSAEVLKAFSEADIMIHGSGPSLVGADNLACWDKQTGKPYGVFGVTLQNPNEYHLELLRKASFIFTRETKSIEHLQKAGLSGGNIRFAPDATFRLHIHDDETAGRFLSANRLEKKKFICAIPRLRYTPYHKFNPNRNGWTDAHIKMVEETNARCAEPDHSKMREAIVTWVRETGNRVLVCPEMTYQVDIMDELLINPLPDDVKPFIVKRGYWLPDEAASVYREAHTVLSFECHSPIIAAANGTPLFYLRQPEDTIKGQMYYDLGFDNYVFEIESTTGKQVSERLMEVYTDYPQAKADLKQSMKIADERYREAFRIFKESV